MVDMVRIAVVGAGAWGINHVRAMSRTKGAELVMVCDVAQAALDRAHAIAPGARLEGGIEAALIAGDVDAVVLATPARDHAEQARMVLNAGKHVLVEKPMALDAADAHAVVSAAETHKRVLVEKPMALDAAVAHAVVSAAETRKRVLMVG